MKLAPLRQHSNGYSGSKNSIRTFQFSNKSDINRINNAIQIMEEMIKFGIFINNDIHLFN